MIAGAGPAPRLVLELVRWLPDTAAVYAADAGGREHYGWGVDRHMRADLFDAIQNLTRAAGQWRKKPPKLPKWPRPKPPKRQKKQGKTSLQELHQRLSGL
ncbi:hypothetical protein [Salininema proteolyticum]|uniref:Uncharacterized protein n=1 Tax=Salininema proteolyticum TaxID=1607685 RepID=A0ABV8TTK5_9ACTN